MFNFLIYANTVKIHAHTALAAGSNTRCLPANSIRMNNSQHLVIWIKFSVPKLECPYRNVYNVQCTWWRNLMGIIKFTKLLYGLQFTIHNTHAVHLTHENCASKSSWPVATHIANVTLWNTCYGNYSNLIYKQRRNVGQLCCKWKEKQRIGHHLIFKFFGTKQKYKRTPEMKPRSCRRASFECEYSSRSTTNTTRKWKEITNQSVVSQSNSMGGQKKEFKKKVKRHHVCRRNLSHSWKHKIWNQWIFWSSRAQHSKWRTR